MTVRRWVQSVDTRSKLFGRGVTQYIRHPNYRGPMHLWSHVPPPPVQNSVVVWVDGSVSEGIEFGPDVFGSPDVHFVVQGGHDYRCSDLDQFTLDSLMAAGYTCVNDMLDLYAENDAYSDEYPRPEATA